MGTKICHRIRFFRMHTTAATGLPWGCDSMMIRRCALFNFIGEGTFANNGLSDWLYWEQFTFDIGGSQERESRVFVDVLSKMIGASVVPPRSLMMIDGVFRCVPNQGRAPQRRERFSSGKTRRGQRGCGRQTAGAPRMNPISGEIGHKKSFTALRAPEGRIGRN